MVVAAGTPRLADTKFKDYGHIITGLFSGTLSSLPARPLRSSFRSDFLLHEEPSLTLGEKLSEHPHAQPSGSNDTFKLSQTPPFHVPLQTRAMVAPALTWDTNAL